MGGKIVKAHGKEVLMSKEQAQTAYASMDMQWTDEEGTQDWLGLVSLLPPQSYLSRAMRNTL